MRDKLLYKTHYAYKLFSIILLWILLPLFISIGLSFKFSSLIWLCIPFLLLGILRLIKRTSRLEIYRKQVVKRFLFTKRIDTIESHKVMFRVVRDVKEGRNNVILSTTSNGDIGNIEFRSVENIEKFVEKTFEKGEGYKWYLASGKGAYRRVNHIISKHDKLRSADK